MAKGKFQNLTIDYRDMLKMTVNDRASILRSSFGQSLMSSLTPQQLSSLFPTYYKERMPDISGFEKAMTPEGAAKLAAEGKTVKEGTYSKAGGTGAQTALQRTPPAAVDRLMKKTGINITDPGAKAQLSSEKREVIDALKKGNIAKDDPRVSFLKDITPEELKKFGIEPVKSGDKEEYKYVPVEVTPEEIDKARKSTITGKSNQEVIMKSFADELRKKGVPAENIPYAVAALAGQVKQESGFNPKAVHDANTGYGIYGARDPQPGRGRKTDMLKWMEQNGYDKDSAEGQARYMVHEAFTKYPKTKSALISANKDNMLEVSGVLVRDFERPKEQHQNTIIRAQHSQGFIDTATRIAAAPNIPDTASDEQIAAALKEEKEKQRELALAEKTDVPDVPSGLNQNLVEYFNKLSPGQKQKFVEALKKEGEGSEDPTATGVARLNESFNADPQNTQARVEAGVSQQGSTTLSFSDKSIAARAESLSDATKASLEKFKVFAPERTVVTSTYRSPTHPIEAAKRTPGAHARGQAIDVRTNDKSKEELAATIQALKKAGFNHILLEGDHIHAEVRPGQNEVNISNLGRGNPNIDLDTARTAAASAEFNVALNEAQEKRRQEQIALEQVEAEQRPIQQRGVLAYTGQKVGVERADLFPKTSAEEASVIDKARAEQAVQETASNRPIQAQTSVESQAPQPQQQEPLFVQPTWSQMAQANPVRAFADGGEMAVNDGEISAQPINAIKGDNSVVVDANKNPLFTMNTKEERANYDPETGKVSVEPVSKNNPDALKNEDRPPEDQGQKPATASERKEENINRMASVTSEMASSPNYSMEAATQLTMNPIHSASFGRAMAATRMMKSTDGLGGHFDHGAANLS